MHKKVKESSGKIESKSEKKLPSNPENKEERKNISQEISGIKTAGKEIKNKHIPEGSPISEEKASIKKSLPSQETKKIMPERTGAPLEKAFVKKSTQSGDIITDDIQSGDTHKDTAGKEKTIKKKKIIKKIIKSPQGERMKKEIIERSDINEQKTSEEDRLLKKMKGKLEEKKGTVRLKEEKNSADDDLIDSLLLAETIKEKPEKEINIAKETVRLKEEKSTPVDDLIASPLLAETIKEKPEKEINIAKETARLKEEKLTPEDDLIASLLLAEEEKRAEEKRTMPLPVSKAKEDLHSQEAENFIHTCLEQLIELGASDLHISTGQQPIIRCRGELRSLSIAPLKKEHTEGLLNTILSRGEKEALLKHQSIDFMYIMPSKERHPHRFRSNVYYHRTGLNVVMRIIPNKIPTIKELGMPDIVSAFGRFHQGLVLVTGSTGSGKTTTLAALIDLINTERNDHIVTIEDPIEFIHKPKRCIVRQRQVGVHTKNYNRALKSSIREDPDVILVSELRDLETIQLAMTAAETGCLVLSTMSTTSAARTIDRIIDFFPADQRLQAGAMLSDSLRAIISQQLIPSTDRTTRFAAVEILIGCTPLSSLIKEQKTFQISSLIETSRGLGMQSMDTSILTLLENKMITYEVAHEAALDKTILEQYRKSE